MEQVTGSLIFSGQIELSTVRLSGAEPTALNGVVFLGGRAVLQPLGPTRGGGTVRVEFWPGSGATLTVPC